MNWTIAYGRDKDDPQKALLPALIWTRDDVLGGWDLALGWWDFSVRIVRYGSHTHSHQKVTK
jgi:hypothetical protein